MNQIVWVLQKNLTKPDLLTKLKFFIQKNGTSFEEVEIIPFSTSLPPIESKNRINVFYGSNTFFKNAKESPTHKNSIFFDEDKFKISTLLKYWKTDMLNYDIEVSKLGDFCLKNYSKNEEFFVRPNKDSKAMNGSIMKFYEICGLLDDLNQAEYSDINSNTVLCFAKPKNIEKEWRCFIVKGKIISASRYMHKGKYNPSAEDIPDNMISFVEEKCNHYTPHDIFVMDIALSNQDFKIIECNCFNSTGFYPHDIERIIQGVNNYLKQK